MIDFQYWCYLQRGRIRDRFKRAERKARGLNSRGQIPQHGDPNDLTGVSEILRPRECALEVRGHCHTHATGSKRQPKV